MSNPQINGVASLPTPAPPILADPELFINRELSWLDFNERVLEEAREALRASEEQYRSLANLVPGVVWTAQADGAIDYANQFWTEFTGMTLEQTLGSGWLAALHPDDVERVSRVWGKALETGELVEVDYRLKRADGVYRRFLARGKALRDRQGRVVKWFGLLTELGQAKESAPISTGSAPGPALR